ncbi:MAG TPA: sulfotransferase family 2 domain-containing protein [Bacteroidia bacterium]|nr:sulfotransferase family 2 domain-containing protein [Bacteroidia bacterium]
MFELIRRIRSARRFRNYEKEHPGNYYSTHCFDYYKCLFVHIPKTAGISVCTTLFGNLAGGHTTLADYSDRYPQATFRSYFKFAFVRNPYDRLHSAFYFLKAGGISSEDRAFRDHYLNGDMNFREFVMEVLSPESKQLIYHLRPQVEYITLKADPENIALDFVGRFESLPADFATAAAHIGLGDKRLPHENKNPGKKYYRDEYSDEMFRRAAQIYKKDFELLGYEM